MGPCGLDRDMFTSRVQGPTRVSTCIDIATCMVHTTNTNLTIDGRFNLAKILDRHPLLESLFKQGMSFTTWTAVAEELFPALPDIAQRALNAKYSVQSGQDIFQCFIRACHLWPDMGSAQEPASKIAADIRSANPTCSERDIYHVVEIARKFGGSAKIVEPMRDFIASYKVPDTKVNADVLKSISTLKLSPSQGEMSPLFIISMFMALASAPTPKLQLTGADVNKITKNQASIEEMKICEKLIKQLLDAAASMEVPTSMANKIINECRVQVVYKYFGKIKSIAKDSYAKITQKAFEALLVHAQSDAQVQSPFLNDAIEADREAAFLVAAEEAKSKNEKLAKKADEEQKAKKQKIEESVSVIQYDENLNAVHDFRQVVLTRGFVVGELVRNKKSGASFTVCVCVCACVH